MFAETTDVPVYSVFDKGEYLNKKKTRKSDSNSISFDVSDKEWDKFAGQVIDTITFLNQHYSSLEELLSSHDIKDAYLDFPLYSRLNDEIVNQNDLLPRELISLAGKLELGIEMSVYAVDAFE
ncbi:MAG: hypothetical protein ACKVH8_22480 [Pirellulales bacterium]